MFAFLTTHGRSPINRQPQWLWLAESRWAISAGSRSEPLSAQPSGLQRQAEMTVLNIHPDDRPCSSQSASTGTADQRCSDGEHQLDQVLDQFRSRIETIHLQPNNARELPLACRDHLIANRAGADLLMYLEDDLVIHDPAFFDKQHWFLEKTDHRFCLMPHRYEPVHQAGIHQLLVDGPLNPQFIGQFMQPQQHAAQGVFRGQEAVNFDLVATPIRVFVVSAKQAEELSEQPLPREGFVGPLETAATTVLHRYPVMKPSRNTGAFYRWNMVTFLSPLPEHIPHQAA